MSGLRRNEDRKSLAWTEGEGEGGACDRGNEEETISFHPDGKDTQLGWRETIRRGKYYRAEG